eukprot:SAG11_NODE_15485_length_576_cov_1.526205_1_plen_31_part_01
MALRLGLLTNRLMFRHPPNTSDPPRAQSHTF